MKILVTGGAGFVGTNLLRHLLLSDNELYSIDNYSIGKIENHIQGIKYINDDIENIFSHSIKFDLIFHLAALSRIQPSFNDPELTFDSNTSGTMKILEFARKNNTPVLYSGSSSMHHNPILSPYAMTKYLGEQLCKLYRESYNLKVHIVRFYNVYGPYEITDGKWAALIGKWRNNIKNNEPLHIVGDGNQRRDFTHINDIVSGLVAISNTNSKNYEWELGSGTNYSINEVFDMFRSKFDCKSIYVDDQKGNYRETLRENDKALDELDWKPKENLKEYIMNL